MLLSISYERANKKPRPQNTQDSVKNYLNLSDLVKQIQIKTRVEKVTTQEQQKGKHESNNQKSTEQSTIIIDNIQGRYFLVVVSINIELLSISFRAKLLTTNYIPYSISDLTIRKRVNEQINRYNSLLTYGSYYVNPQNGEVEFRLVPVFAKLKFYELAQDSKKMNAYLQKQYSESVYNSIKNSISQLDRYLSQQWTQTKNRPATEILSIMENNHIAVTKALTSNVKPPDLKLRETRLNGCKQVNKQTITQMDTLLVNMQQKPLRHKSMAEIQKIANDLTLNIVPMMHLLQQPKVCQKDNATIVTPVWIFGGTQLSDWTMFVDNNNNKLLRLKTKIYFVDGITKQQVLKDEKAAVQRMLVSKRSGNRDCSDIKQEKAVLKLLRTHNSFYVTRYFQCINLKDNKMPPWFQHSIFMEYYTYRSLNRYIEQHEMSLTNTTRLMLVVGLIFGVRFLRSVGCAHLDLKPSNTLITKNLTTRLCDFSQAYISVKDFKKNNQPGYTLPYSPPQIFDEDTYYKAYWDKMDVFSIGIIIMHVLFKFKSQCSKQKLEQLYRDKSYYSRVIVCPERAHSYFKSTTAQIMFYVALRCLDEEPTKRPSIDWVGYIFKSLSIYENS